MKELLRIEQISKCFGDFYANRDISLEVREGEVLTLLGENGAGKSTLMNILIGLYQPTSGKIFLHGKEQRIASPKQAVKLGIGMVHQHFMLIDAMTVFENIILGEKRSKGIWINKEARRKEILDLSKKYGLELNLDALISEISVGEQQRVEIVKALYHGAKLLILDEPTAALTDIEVEGLFKIITTLKEEGKSVIFISHKMREVLRISDRISVLRLGRLVGSLDCREVDGPTLANMMMGKELKEERYEKKVKNTDSILQLKNIKYHPDKKHNGINDISLEVHAGEIVGIAGVDGNGQTQLAQLITGVIQAEQGEILIQGKNMKSLSVEDFIRCGVSHVPEDRNLQGLVGDMNISDNLLLKSLEEERFSVGKGLFLKKKAIKKYAKELVEKYDIRCSDISLEVRSLSGGNQQKAVFGRWVLAGSKVLLLDEPTRGVDVGAKVEIYNIINEVTSQGGAVLMVSSELPEILGMSDRVVVMSGGRIAGEMDAADATQDSIMQLAVAQVEDHLTAAATAHAKKAARTEKAAHSGAKRR